MSCHKHILHIILPCATFPENQEYDSQLCAECAVSNTLQGVNKVEMVVTSCCCVTKERQKLVMRITNCVELKKPKKGEEKRKKHRNYKYKKEL
jgi:DNA-binding transcriptional regulator LsrR (DeoR family)